MLTLFRFVLGMLTFGWVIAYAIRTSGGADESESSTLSPRDNEEFRKTYGDSTPF